MDLEKLEYDFPLVSKLKNKEPIFFESPIYTEFELEKNDMDLSLLDIKKASDRLKRFEPFFLDAFEDMEATKGIVESPIVRIPTMKDMLEEMYGVDINNSVYLKLDNLLPISGSVKARGGIYNVLKIAEDVAREELILEEDSDYSQFLEGHFTEVFSQYRLICGSTGNLGLSVGIIGQKLGFRTEIHMSSDAEEWKKKKLRDIGVTVVEHDDDYTAAVRFARLEALKSKRAYFVDDENSKTLFLGYAVAALRLKEQMNHARIDVNKDYPLYVYLPCGVGSAPGGIAFGLKHMFGEGVHPIFVEPVSAPSFTLGAITKKYADISIYDIGLDGVTSADGLAVGRPSKFVSKMMGNQVYGYMTVKDDDMFKLLKHLRDTEGFKIEPSAAAGLAGPAMLSQAGSVRETATHLVWLTGGSAVPTEVWSNYYEKGDF